MYVYLNKILTPHRGLGGGGEIHANTLLKNILNPGMGGGGIEFHAYNLRITVNVMKIHMHGGVR